MFTQGKLLLPTLALVFTVLGSTAPCSAATLTYDGSGRLTGALAVVVAGVDYDVSFVDGSCAGAYPSCNDDTVFWFDTVGKAIGAAEALQQQVFAQDGSATVFGCGMGYCQAWLPYEVSAGTESGVNAIRSGGLGTYSVSVTYDTAPDFSITRTVWSPALTAMTGITIPTLPILAQLLMGFALLLAYRARRGLRR